MLIEYAERFREVPAHICERPYPAANRVPACESDAYIFVKTLPSGSLELYFAVESPQGISAKALSVILHDTLSGLPAAEIAAIPEALVYSIFGRELSMGKGVGLIGMVSTTKSRAREAL